MVSNIDFPSSIGAPDYPLGETLEDAVIRSNMEDGTVKTRPKFTRNRKTYDVSWGHMTETEKATFQDFFENTLKNGALSFNWTHPSSGKQLTVIMTEPPSFSLSLLHYWKVSMKVQEV